MTVEGAYLYYGTNPEERFTHYPAFKECFGVGRKITTQLPKNVAIIRAVVVMALSFYAILAYPVLSPLLTPLGFFYAGWTVYSHLLRSDPLVGVFYQIVGGKERYDALPTIELVDHGKPFSDTVKTIDWNSLDQPLYKATTNDGRAVLIVKGLDRHKIKKSIFAFIEKLGPTDSYPMISNLTPRQSYAFESLAQALSMKENQMGGWVSSSYSSHGDRSESKETHMPSSMTSEMANEFMAQLSRV